MAGIVGEIFAVIFSPVYVCKSVCYSYKLYVWRFCEVIFHVLYFALMFNRHPINNTPTTHPQPYILSYSQPHFSPFKYQLIPNIKFVTNTLKKCLKMRPAYIGSNYTVTLLYI